MAMFWRKDKTTIESPEKRTLAASQTAVKRFLIKAVGMVSRSMRDREELTAPEHNLEEIRRAAAADSYIRVALARYSHLIFKAGYTLKGENETAVEYIKKRFRVMSFATSVPMDVLLQQVSDDLNKFANAFLLKSRTKKPYPGIRMKGVFNDDPVGGYFIVDPTTILIKRDNHGTVIKYVQKVPGQNEKSFSPDNVIHFYVDKESGYAFGTPRISAALEDVKLLRKMEGIVVSMVYRFAIPLFQWIVGLEDPALGATETEVKDAQREVENMPLDGVVITNERTKIKVIGAEGEALDAAGYLKYFENRVFSALSMSQAQMGRGGSKQDSDSMEAQAHDVVKNLQRNLAVFIENYLIAELLLEGGFDPILDEKDIVRFEFEEISLETKIKKENHEVLKFQSDIVTFEELRRNLGKKEAVDESRLFTQMIKNKAILEQIGAKSTGSAGNGQPVNTHTSKAAKNMDMPRNQHGTRLAPKIKEVVCKTPVKDNKTLYDYTKIIFTYNEIKNTTIEQKISPSQAYKKHRETLKKAMDTILTQAVEDGWVSGKNDAVNITGTLNETSPPEISTLTAYTDARLIKLFEDLDKKISTKNNVAVSNSFETMEYRIRFIMEYVAPKAFWTGYLKAGADARIKTATVDFGDSDDDIKYPDEVNTTSYRLSEIPPYHAHCDCTLHLKAGDSM